jgi:hypothetical protein
VARVGAQIGFDLVTATANWQGGDGVAQGWWPPPRSCLLKMTDYDKLGESPANSKSAEGA